MIRRPDVVIVKDPTQPPIQDNIKQVVEMKFPPDPRKGDQTDAYEEITGDVNKVVVLTSTNCDCSQQQQESKVPVEKLGWVATALSILAYIATLGKTPRPIPPVLVH